MKVNPKQLAIHLPAYPRTPHVPYKPNMGERDKLADNMDYLFASSNIIVEEKVDGANCAIMFLDGEIIVRNRNHILCKGYLKNTPAKLQFRPLWNWAYSNKKLFGKLNKLFGRAIGVYGEWLWAIHGVIYNNLPSPFVAFDLYNPDVGFVHQGRYILDEVGFQCVPLVHEGPISSFEFLSQLCNQKSLWGEELREGLYIKNSDGKQITNRAKMIRPGYKQGWRWSKEQINRQPH